MIHKYIINRYMKMISETGMIWSECQPDHATDLVHLNWMLGELYDERVTGEKAHRWLGYIQGVLICRGLTAVQIERDFTRPYFTEPLT